MAARVERMQHQAGSRIDQRRDGAAVGSRGGGAGGARRGRQRAEPRQPSCASSRTTACNKRPTARAEQLGKSGCHRALPLRTRCNVEEPKRDQKRDTIETKSANRSRRTPSWKAPAPRQQPLVSPDSLQARACSLCSFSLLLTNRAVNCKSCSIEKSIYQGIGVRGGGRSVLNQSRGQMVLKRFTLTQTQTAKT